MITYPAITPTLRQPSEPITQTPATLLNYWQWAHSNLVDNAERGALVHLAVGAASETRVNWDKYDILSPDGIRIEVNAAGYIQSWAQEKPSAISFSIRPTYGWDSATNTYATTASRQSDVYVFCLHAHTDQETINPLDTAQWRFFVLATKVLNVRLANAKTASLKTLVKLGAVETEYTDLRETILKAGALA